uniref:Helix-turn-helix transcriptional regulator n=2 Tax=Bacteria TaxID=2 RepID=A0A7C9JPJ5_9BACT
MRKRCEQVAREFNLSERELEVLLLLAQGRRAAQIKDDLFISINTVRVHTRNIYNKLDVHSVKQLTDIVESVVL